MAGDPALVGKWETLVQLRNVAVHASLVPKGDEILFWGRRAEPKSTVNSTMNETKTSAFLFNIKSNSVNPSPGPGVLDKVNLFCSGHCWQPDGTLIVVGGHIKDGEGSDQACVFNPESKKWTALEPLPLVKRPKANDPRDTDSFKGRWYPSALCLSDGAVLCISGSSRNGNPVPIPVIRRNNKWEEVVSHGALNLYPDMQLGPDGRVFIAGPQWQSFYLNLTRNDENGRLGGWDSPGNLRRDAGFRDYASCVMYEPGKIVYIGGGNDPLPTDKQGSTNGPPTSKAEFIDLNKGDNARWETLPSMKFPRRHHNGTVLPDGSIGGTSGNDFNNVVRTPATATKPESGPVHFAELFIPKDNAFKSSKDGQWVTMANEDQDRCYHSVALLLPDGRVFSAGSGEWAPKNDDVPNDPIHSHTDAQFFSPPYLFQGGNRPEVTGVPTVVEYGTNFDVSIKNFDTVKMVSWHRIGSTTHSTNMSQSRRTLTIIQSLNGKLTVKAPEFSTDCPPGHYMLFVLDSRGVPAVASIIQLTPLTGKNKLVVKPAARVVAAESQFHPSLHVLEEQKTMQQRLDPVVIGLTTVCPYGLGPCWGGAYEALHHLTNIGTVQVSANQANSVAFVYLKQDTLPDIDQWREELVKIVNSTYYMRGLEMILSGVVKAGSTKLLTLSGNSTRPDLPLAPLKASNKVQWDNVTKAPQPMTDAESGAFERLQKEVATRPDSTFKVTGALLKQGAGQFLLEVRDFKPVEPET